MHVPAQEPSTSPGASTTSTHGGHTDDVLSVFGFATGDIVVWSHGQRKQLKRHNCSRTSSSTAPPRNVSSSAVSAICRVRRADEGRAPAGGNEHTQAYADVVIGFDNGCVAICRLNETGGYLVEDRTVWLGHFAVNVIAPCPLPFNVLALGCGDGSVRFVNHPRFTDRAAVAGAAMAHGDVGTERDARVAAVAHGVTSFGGVTDVLWLPGGGTLAAAGEDDAVSFVSVALRPLFDGGAGDGSLASSTCQPSPLLDRHFHGAPGSVHASRPGSPQADPLKPPPGAGGRRNSLRQWVPLFAVDVVSVVHRAYHKSWITSLSVMSVATPAPESPSDISVLSFDGHAGRDGAELTTALLVTASEDGRVALWQLPAADGDVSVATPARSTAPGSQQSTRRPSLTPGGPPDGPAFPRAPVCVLPKPPRAGTRFAHPDDQHDVVLCVVPLSSRVARQTAAEALRASSTRSAGNSGATAGLNGSHSRSQLGMSVGSLISEHRARDVADEPPVEATFATVSAKGRVHLWRVGPQ
jgi:hypothetical protein